MLEFKKIEISDKDWVDRLLAFSDYRGAEYCFTNLFIWDSIYKTKIARFKDFLIVRVGTDEECSYLYPAGRGNIREVLDLLIEVEFSKGEQLSLIGLTSLTKEELKQIYPGGFKFETNRDSYDYIYESSKLITLSGKKLQSKRNHVNHFISNYNYKFEMMKSNDIPEVQEFNQEWCKRADCKQIETLSWELCAVKKCLKYFDELKLSGGVLRVDGGIVGYTIGEVLNSDTVIIHIEKAFSEIRGAYPSLNKEFASRLAADYKYVNREDDIGDSGLRKAKESYYPIFMVEKYSAILF